MILEKHHHSNL